MVKKTRLACMVPKMKREHRLESFEAATSIRRRQSRIERLGRKAGGVQKRNFPLFNTQMNHQSSLIQDSWPITCTFQFVPKTILCTLSTASLIQKPKKGYFKKFIVNQEVTEKYLKYSVVSYISVNGAN